MEDAQYRDLPLCVGFKVYFLGGQNRLKHAKCQSLNIFFILLRIHIFALAMDLFWAFFATCISFANNWCIFLSLHTIQVILFEINCAIFYTNLHELFCQFISWTNWVNSGKFMDNLLSIMSSYGWYWKLFRRSYNY